MVLETSEDKDSWRPVAILTAPTAWGENESWAPVDGPAPGVKFWNFKAVELERYLRLTFTESFNGDAPTIYYVIFYPGASVEALMEAPLHTLLNPRKAEVALDLLKGQCGGASGGLSAEEVKVSDLITDEVRSVLLSGGGPEKSAAKRSDCIKAWLTGGELVAVYLDGDRYRTWYRDDISVSGAYEKFG